jgi:hypothetical protein
MLTSFIIFGDFRKFSAKKLPFIPENHYHDNFFLPK